MKTEQRRSGAASATAPCAPQWRCRSRWSPSWARSTWGWSVTTLHCRSAMRLAQVQVLADTQPSNPRHPSLRSQPYIMPDKSQSLLQLYGCRPVVLSSCMRGSHAAQHGACKPAARPSAGCRWLALRKRRWKAGRSTRVCLPRTGSKFAAGTLSAGGAARRRHLQHMQW